MLEKGRATIVMGAQFGDEGKGKFVDVLAEEADFVCRVQGGNNAGHTIYIGEEKIVTHLLPIGILRESCEVAIGAGVVIDPVVLFDEFKMIANRGVNLDPKRVHLDGRAHIILPFHKLKDGERESERAKSGAAIGTTGRGIGPAYASRAYRDGLTLANFINEENFRAHLEAHPHLKAGLEGETFARFLDIAQFLRPFVKDAAQIACDALNSRARLLIEGAQGALLDPSFGTYPYVTSSNLFSGASAAGIGIPPQSISQVIGVIKAYSTRVGNGPYPGELHGSLETHLRDVGKEFGATTGRPRRVGWLDLVALRYMSQTNGFTSLALMKSDVLCGFEQVGIVTSYRNKKTTDAMTQWPLAHSDWENVDAVVEFLPGWKDLVVGKSMLDKNFVRFMERVEEAAGAHIDYVSTGPTRDGGIWRKASK